MSRVNTTKPTRTLLYSILVLSAVAITFCFTLKTSHVTASPQRDVKETSASVAPMATFPANSGTLGAIPDGTALSPLPSYGGARDVTFTVSGLPGNVATAAVSFTVGAPVHSFRGDIEVTLKGPGGTPSHLLFSRTNATSPTSFGSASDLTGPYNFTDTATGTNWWTVTATPTTPGDYRSVGPGPSATTPPVTSINTAFASTAANGTWTLSFRDGCSADTGAVSAASLTLTAAGPPPTDAPVDFNGDGITDFVVVRNTGGGPTGQITWFGQQNGGAAQIFIPWGTAQDFFVPEDYDGDNKTDVAVWRPGAPFTAAFYVFQSLTSTVRSETFGQTGDDPTVVGDYDGDGKADLAVYRGGAASGDPSFWYWRQAVAGPVFNRQWGQNGDFLAPGDYDGDGKNDFSIQRNNGGGQAAFYTNYAAAAAGVISRLSVFGTPTDVVVPGDYDGDNKTDVATIRGIGGQIHWYVEPSTALGTFTDTTWGLSASDFPVQGDYDGDNKTDHAVWRPNADPTQNFFFATKSNGGGFIAVDWGQNGDYPVANFNSH